MTMRRVVAGAAVLAVAAGLALGIRWRRARAWRPPSIALSAWDPTPTVHLAAHPTPRPKFYVIDAHSHVNDAMGLFGAPVPPARVVATMDSAGVRTIVILTGRWGAALQQVLDTMVKPYPGRFVVFTQIDWRRIDEPDFSRAMVAQLDDAVARGARGLKVLKDLGLTVRDSSGRLIAIDDPRLDPIWEEAGRLGIPVAMHSSDPEAFFAPVDAHNERFDELSRHPDWSFARPGYPSKATLLAERNHVIREHPHTTFIALHVANWPENLDSVSAWLRTYPNMMVELGAREAELGRQPRRALRFFEEFQDRILFGTDTRPSAAMYANYYRWLESADEYFPYWGYPGQGRWRIYGLALPDSILAKVYHANAERVLGVRPGGVNRGIAFPNRSR